MYKGARPAKHVLSSEQFKALATQTRGTILKLLGQRKHTQAEIAERLGFAAPTIKQHVDALLKAGLIAKEQTERKWKYLSLTPVGHAILNPEEKTFLFLLTTTCIAALGGLFGWLRTYLQNAYADALTARTAERAAAPTAETAPGIPWGLIAFLLVLGFLAGMTAYFGWRSKRNRDMVAHRAG